MTPAASDSSVQCLLFGPFELLPRARILRRSGIPVAIGSRALDLLIALVEQAGEVVKQRDLIHRAWRGLVVEPSNLRVQMTYLRRSLGDGDRGARYIANVPGQGYCFVAPVRCTKSEESRWRTTLQAPGNRWNEQSEGIPAQ
jgi:DNA-binding winged helix-turn-helix (wHTH) protein